MRRFEIILALINNPDRTKFQTEYANNMISAINNAENHNHGYFVKEIKEDLFYFNGNYE